MQNELMFSAVILTGLNKILSILFTSAIATIKLDLH
jgi:hypothetical protein